MSTDLRDAATATSFRTCPLCEATCGLEIHHDGQRVHTIRGDEHDVFSQGFICPKGAALHHLHEDTDRLTSPRIKREGSWEEVSWTEAFEEVERRLTPILEEHGRNAVGIYLGNPNTHNMSGILYNKALLKALGTRNLFSASTVDQMPKHVSSGLLFGAPTSIPVPDLDRTDFLLILGANPWVSNGSLCTAPDFPGRLRALQERGGSFVVIDPRQTETARRANAHHFIRPGTDALLLFAMVHTLFDEELVEPGRLEPHIQGLERIREAASPFSADSVSARCGLETETIRDLARQLARAERGVVYGRLGTCAVRFGTLTSWLVDVLNILTGNLDEPGGAMFPRAAHARHRPEDEPGGRGFLLGRWRSRVSGHPEAMSELPVACLAEEIETPGEGQLRAMITVAGNPALSTPDSGRLDAALQSLDFMVCVDPYLNETTRHADVILPPPSPLVRAHYDLAFYPLAVRNIAHYSPPVFELPEDALPEYDILLTLTAIVSGFGAATPPAMADGFVLRQVVERELGDESSPLHGLELDAVLEELGEAHGPERIVEFLVRAGPYGDHFGRTPAGLTMKALREATHGIDLGPLTPQLPHALKTPSGKIELDAEPVIEDVARLVQALEEEPRDTMLLIGRRHLRSNNSWMHNVEMLVRGRQRCTLLLHPADASRLGLEDGELARVCSSTGALHAPVEVSEKMMPGVASLPHGWGHDQPDTELSVASEHAGANFNVLVDTTELDPLSGNAVFQGFPVEIEPASA